MVHSEKDVDSMVKGRIAETLTEMLFRDLGFLVFEFGQEHQISPIVQLKEFIKTCGGHFDFKKDWKNTTTYDSVRNLPDFLIVCDKKEPRLLEVKFRGNAQLNKEQSKAFELFEGLLILVINTNPGNYFFDNNEFESQKTEQDLLKSRFHIHQFNQKTKKRKIVSLQKFLQEEYGLNDAEEIIQDYEKNVNRWLEPKNTN